jgi:hypothetical protein
MFANHDAWLIRVDSTGLVRKERQAAQTQERNEKQNS